MRVKNPNHVSYHSAEKLELAARQAIDTHRPDSLRKLQVLIHTPRIRFKQLGVDIDAIFKEFGIERSKKGGNNHTVESLSDIVRSTILEAGRYLQDRELSVLTGISAATLRAYKIDTCQIAETLGFKKKPAGGDRLIRKAASINFIEETYERLILKELTPVPLSLLSSKVGLTVAALHKRFGGMPGVEAFHKKLGVSYYKPSWDLTNNEILQACKAEIERQSCYVPQSFLAKLIDVPPPRIRSAVGSIVELNLSYGYSSHNKHFENSVYKVLCEIFGPDSIEREKYFEDLKSSYGRYLRFDFYIKSQNLIIEADGSQHFQESNRYNTEQLKISDQIKDLYCKEKGINLVRFKYRALVKKSDIEQLLKLQ